MRAGVGYPSWLGGAAVSGNGFDPVFPVSNALDLKRIRRVARADGTGARTITMTLAGLQPVQMVALVHHTGLAGTTVGLALSDDGGQVGGGSAVLPARTLNQPQTAPLVLAAPVVARTVVLTLGDNGATPWEIGGLEVAGFYEWPNVNSDQQRGVLSASQRVQQPGGVDATMRQWGARVTRGTRGMTARAEMESAVMDFQRATGTSEPFVWTADADDSTRWARESFLARNATLSAGTASSNAAGEVAFDHVEHLG